MPRKTSIVRVAEVQRDIANFKSALARAGVAEGFLPVAAPASVIPDRRNEHYASDDELLEAIGNAMRTEYRAIIDAGLLLQLDDARAAVTYDRMVPPASFADYRRWLERQVEITNAAIAGLPREKIRYHVCWGSWPGPHTTDVPMRDYSDEEIHAYIQTGDPFDKAGAYAIQHASFQPVINLAGCYTSVMGLPMCHVLRMMHKMGFSFHATVPVQCEMMLEYQCPLSQGILNGMM